MVKTEFGFTNKNIRIIGIEMRQSPSRGVKLTTVIFAVLVLAVSALLSNSSQANDTDVEMEQSK